MARKHKPELTVLRALEKVTAETGLPPTLRELAGAAGFRSPSGVARHVEYLESIGAVKRRAGAFRSLQITPKGKRMIREP